MMGRLVDIDEVIRIAENTFPQEDVRKIMWVLCHTPTAYDISKMWQSWKKNNKNGKRNYQRAIQIIWIMRY